MKRKNKETGEIAHFEIYKVAGLSDDGNPIYEPFKGNIEEWEDYEEPKEYWTVDCGVATKYTWDDEKYDRAIEAVGLKFETKEECERAMKKMKAWKRLKDKGFKFIYDGETGKPMFVYSGANREKCVTTAEESKQCMNDVKFIFGGEDA